MVPLVVDADAVTLIEDPVTLEALLDGAVMTDVTTELFTFMVMEVLVAVDPFESVALAVIM